MPATCLQQQQSLADMDIYDWFFIGVGIGAGATVGHAMASAAPAAVRFAVAQLLFIGQLLSDAVAKALSFQWSLSNPPVEPPTPADERLPTPAAKTPVPKMPALTPAAEAEPSDGGLAAAQLDQENVTAGSSSKGNDSARAAGRAI